MDKIDYLENYPVIAQYDMREIQNFIFRTNKLKEIVGASFLVSNLLEDMLIKVLEDLKVKDKNLYILDWKYNLDGYKFDEDENIKMEVLYSNAGNATILFRSKELCLRINKILSKYLIQFVPGLNLAIAIVKKTNNYEKDYGNLMENMQQVKTNMPFSGNMCNFPFIQFEGSTGYPLEYFQQESKKYVSKETHQKLDYYYKNQKEIGKRQLLDNLVEEKGDSSSIAVVHIDGNNMGSKIGLLMNGLSKNKGTVPYEQAVPKIKYISNNIHVAFNEKGFKAMTNTLENWMYNEKGETGDYKKYFRPVINAGDDITFICTAKLAIGLSIAFLNEISKYSLIGYTDTEKKLYPNQKEHYPFSACAGVSIINSHFPFSEAYNVAEACCKSAKRKGKQVAKEKNEEASNWIDFQICKNMYLSNNMEEKRLEQYKMKDGTSLLTRPYHVDKKDTSLVSFTTFENFYKICSDTNKVPNHWAKELRNSYMRGKHAANLLLSKMKASGINCIGDLYTEKDTAIYYDVLEMLEFYTALEASKEGC